MWPRLQLDVLCFFLSRSTFFNGRTPLLEVRQETAHWTLLVVSRFAEIFLVPVLTLQGPPHILHVFSFVLIEEMTFSQFAALNF